jgi:hypothetical protein
MPTIRLVVVYRQLGPAQSNFPVTAEWFEELFAGRYRPMRRLLSEDFPFPALATRL